MHVYGVNNSPEALSVLLSLIHAVQEKNGIFRGSEGISSKDVFSTVPKQTG